MITSNLCYVPPSVEYLGPTTPPALKFGFTTPRFQTRLMPLCWTVYREEWVSNPHQTRNLVRDFCLARAT